MFLILRLLSLCGLAVAGFVHAQTYPVKAVRIIVGFPAGGATDVTARVYGQKIGEYWDQNVIVENRSGANGMIGAESVVRAPKDGYTMYLSTPSEVALNGLLYSKMSYEPLKDLAPISLVVIYPNVIVVHPSVPVKTIREMIALARRTPGGLAYGTTGVGTTQQIAGEWLKRHTGVNLNHVPYKGGAPANIDLAGGHIPTAIVGLGSAMPNIKSGRARAIAVTSKQRSAALPEVGTLYESGFNFDATQWFGVLTTAGTPAEVIARIQAALARAATEPVVKERLIALGGDPVSSTPDEYAALIKSETTKFEQIIKAAGIKGD